MLTIFIGTASAETWYVDDHGDADFTSIHDAVNSATAGDIIVVKDGTYNENVDVNKRLTIRSENGSDSTTVIASNSNDHVFEVTADYVNISGFTVMGAIGGEPGVYPYPKAGISLEYRFNNCKIYNNNITGNNFGIWLKISSNNTLINNNVNSNFYYEPISKHLHSSSS